MYIIKKYKMTESSTDQWHWIKHRDALNEFKKDFNINNDEIIQVFYSRRPVTEIHFKIDNNNGNEYVCYRLAESKYIGRIDIESLIGIYKINNDYYLLDGSEACYSYLNFIKLSKSLDPVIIDKLKMRIMI